MYNGQIFKNKHCLVCNNEYTPNSSVQKFCLDCRELHRKRYKKEWAQKNRNKLNKNSKKWYWSNIEKARASKRKWNWSEKGRSARKKWNEKNIDKIYKNLKKYKNETRSRIKANNIIKNLGLVRECAICGSCEKVQIHHQDKNPHNNDIRNLTLLCLRHHKLMHRHKIPESDQNPTS